MGLNSYYFIIRASKCRYLENKSFGNGIFDAYLILADKIPHMGEEKLLQK